MISYNPINANFPPFLHLQSKNQSTNKLNMRPKCSLAAPSEGCEVLFHVDVPKKLLDEIDRLAKNTTRGDWRTTAEMIKLGLAAPSPDDKPGVRKKEPNGFVLRRALVILCCEQFLTMGLPMTEQDGVMAKRCCEWLMKILHMAKFTMGESHSAFRLVLKSRVKKRDACNKPFGDGAANKAKTAKRMKSSHLVHAEESICELSPLQGMTQGQRPTPVEDDGDEPPARAALSPGSPLPARLNRADSAGSTPRTPQQDGLRGLPDTPDTAPRLNHSAPVVLSTMPSSPDVPSHQRTSKYSKEILDVYVYRLQTRAHNLDPLFDPELIRAREAVIRDDPDLYCVLLAQKERAQAATQGV